MTRGVQAGWSALLLLAVRLNDIQFTISPQRSLNKPIEPRFRQFPAFMFIRPSRFASSAVLKPPTIVLAIRKSSSQDLTLSSSSQHHRARLLVPECPEALICLKLSHGPQVIHAKPKLGPRPNAKSLADFLIDADRFTRFDGDGQPIADRLIKSAALLAAEYTKCQGVAVNERHRSFA